jgi:formylglycine-generating enzyme required for sulfatase activity
MKRYLVLLFCLLVGGSGIHAQNDAELVIFREGDYLAVYVTSAGQPVSVEGINLQVGQGDEAESYSIEEYTAFVGLPFGALPTPACFFLYRSGAQVTPPLECQSSLLLRQALAASDIFWFDPIANTQLLLTVKRGDAILGICSGSEVDGCRITLLPVLPTTTTATPTLGAAPQGITATPDPDIRIETYNGHEFALIQEGDYLNSFTEAFWMGVYEVTNAQFAAFLNVNGNQSSEGKEYYNARGSGGRISRTGGQWRVEADFENHPAVRVTWYGARDYCESIAARLPTALEWEKAAGWDISTGQRTNYPWGNDLPDETRANYGAALDTNTAPVDDYPSGVSQSGAYNMSGNVGEWVADTQGINRSWRGGDWNSDASGISVVSGGSAADTFTTAGIGFRCAVTSIENN